MAFSMFLLGLDELEGDGMLVGCSRFSMIARREAPFLGETKPTEISSPALRQEFA